MCGCLCGIDGHIVCGVVLVNGRNIILKIEYRGTGFAGWQRQSDARTVQEVLERTMSTFLREQVKLTGSGRTDAGVHALAQVASGRITHSMSVEEIRYRLNRMLPEDVVIVDCREVRGDFNARRDALWRHYRYLICERLSAVNRDISWVLGKKLNLSLLQRMAKMIETAKHFDGFCKSRSRRTNNDCMIHSAKWSRYSGFLRFDVRADRFLHNMVRLLVGSMVAVCQDRMSVEDLRMMLMKRAKAKHIAPACGLYLAGVKYERIGP